MNVKINVGNYTDKWSDRDVQTLSCLYAEQETQCDFHGLRHVSVTPGGANPGKKKEPPAKGVEVSGDLTRG